MNNNNNIFLSTLDEIKISIQSIDTSTISKKDFDTKATQIKQKISYLKNIQVNSDYKKMHESTLIFINNLFKKKIEEFKKIESEKNNKQQKQNERTIRNISPNITNENLQKALKNPTEFTQLKILSSEPDTVIVNKLNYVEEKYQDVLELESNILELHQMFLDFALIVDKQGQLLDHVEIEIKFASDSIEEGNKTMITAIDYQKQYRKKQLCLCFFVLIILAILAIIIYITTLKH
jgi:t-SNARE complex subunit (syntaxin)